MTNRRRPTEPEFRRRHVEYTPAQLARQDAIGDELIALSRERNPERYAPDGTPLIGYFGTSWSERLWSWRAQNGYPDPLARDSFMAEAASRDGNVAASVVGGAVREGVGTP